MKKVNAERKVPGSSGGRSARHGSRGCRRRPAAALMAVLAGGPAWGQCVQQWSGDFGVPPGMNFDVYALTVWDPDGAAGPAEPQLVAAGVFGTAGGMVVNKIARWDGVAWRPFANGMGTNTAPGIYALTTWDPDGAGPQDPQLIVGGHFGTGSGVVGNYIVRWDVGMQAFQPLSTGMNNDVWALTVWDPDGSGPIQPQLVAGGSFTTAGGTTVNRVARWDGAAWQPLGSGAANGSVLALSVYDPDGPGPMPDQLVAAGSFTSIGGSTILRIAKFDGTTWTGFGAGVNSTVWALQHWDSGTGDQLYAGGDFTASGATLINRIARWDGSAWQPLGAGVGNTVRAMTVWDPDGPGGTPTRLVASGLFTSAGGNTINRIAVWDGAAWSGLGTSVNGGAVYALATVDLDRAAGPAWPQLVAGGDFTLAAGNIANRVAAWVSNASPLVITSPSDTRGCLGGQVQLTVRAAAGAFPSYQWRRAGVNLADGTTGNGSSITGATSITLTINGLTFADLGSYDVVVTNACGSATSLPAEITYTCYGNCDCSSTPPILNVSDFTCFLNRFAAGSPNANCDRSTTPPVLNVSDFTCFLNMFAAGCS
jgi:Immunoglobulin domain